MENVSYLPDLEEEGDILVNSWPLLYKLRTRVMTSYQCSHKVSLFYQTSSVYIMILQALHKSTVRFNFPVGFNIGPSYLPPFCSSILYPPCLHINGSGCYSLPYTCSRLEVSKMWIHGPNPACWLCEYGL